MINIDFSSLNLDSNIFDQLRRATEDLINLSTLRERYDYINSHDNLWRMTLSALACLTNNSEDNCKCWYCECDGSAGFSFHIDHFRPKSRVKNKGYKRDQYEPGYWWLAFNPFNYRIACQRCNTGAGKKDQFPLNNNSARAIIPGGEQIEEVILLDPANLTDPDLLCFSRDGDVNAAPDCEELDKNRVNASISVYNLRARSKIVSRKRIWQECEVSIINAKSARERLKESILLSDERKQTMLNEFKRECLVIKKMILPNAKFSKTARSCVRYYFKIELTKARLQNFEHDLDWLIGLL